MRTFLGAFALFVLALALRLPHGELAEWKGDEAIQFAHARKIAREHVLPARGLPTTEGPRLSVHYLYALALPLVFEDDPEAIRKGIALLASFVILLVFLVGKEDVGARTALAWALLLAVLPDEVRRGRWAWHPNLVPPLATLALLALLRARRKPEGNAGAALLLLAALMPLIHYSLVGLAALSFFFALFATKNRRALLAGFLLAFFTLLPHLAVESRSRFEATRGALSVAGAKKDDPERAPLHFPALLAGELELESYARAAGLEPPAFAPFVSWATKGLALAGIALALLAARKARAQKKPLLGAPQLALLAALAAWAPFLLLRLPARHHYVQSAFPALVFLVAHAIVRLRAGALLGVIGLGSVLSVWLVLLGAERGLVEAGTGYDIPYGKKKAACEEVLSKELTLVRFPSFEYLVLLEQCWRELPEKERARFELVPDERARYWDLVVLRPEPQKPHGRAAIFAVSGKAQVVELP